MPLLSLEQLYLSAAGDEVWSRKGCAACVPAGAIPEGLIPVTAQYAVVFP